MANYDNLTPDQQADFDRLMTQPTNRWPAELVTWVQSWGGPFSGDALADAVAGWVKQS